MRRIARREATFGLARDEAADLTSLSIIKIGIAMVGMLSIALLLTLLS